MLLYTFYMCFSTRKKNIYLRNFFFPILFLGMGTSAERSSCNTNYYTRGDVLPGIWVDGMDVLSVKNASDFAIKYALEHGPVVMEVHTYR